MAGSEASSRTKNSLPDMELVAEEQTIAIGRLESKLKKIEEQNKNLIEEIRRCSESQSLKEAESLRHFIASDIRLAQAESILPCKRLRLSSDVDPHDEINVVENESFETVHPAVDFVYQKGHELVKTEKSQQQQSYDDLIAWKFNPDSISGRRLITCFRHLLERNKSLGAINESDSLSKLESETQLQDSCIRECMKTAQDFNTALLESSVDLDGVQNSLFALKKKLNKAENLIAALKDEYEKVNPGQSDALIGAALASLSQQAINIEGDAVE
ncbi:hypothetical protein Aperf_G00000109810 [Anoplocephala perfoliata]